MALLMRSLGSPNWMMNQDLCGGCRALSDKVTGLGIVGGEDVDNTRCALIAGRNPSAADPVQWMGLKKVKEKRGEIHRDRSGGNAGRQIGGYMAASQTR